MTSKLNDPEIEKAITSFAAAFHYGVEGTARAALESLIAQRLAERDALIDEMLTVAKKVGSGMPMLTDSIIQRMAALRSKP